MSQDAETDFREYRRLQKRHVRRASDLPLIPGKLRCARHVTRLNLLGYAVVQMHCDVVENRKKALMELDGGDGPRLRCR
jgi:hypothetical protein